MDPERTMVVFDFDGTLTSLTEECHVTIPQIHELVRRILRYNPTKYNTLVAEKREAVKAEPHRYGRVHLGHISAAPFVDPYVEIHTIAELVMATKIRSHEERLAILTDIFREINRTMVSYFKREALETMLAVVRQGYHHVCVVTNSGTETVQRKLDELDRGRGRLGSIIDNVRGHAGKHHIDPRHKCVPAPHLDVWDKRPTHVRRPDYFSVLDAERRATGVPWENVVVVGDIFEPDLATPFALGAKVLLVYSLRVPSYEIDFIRSNQGRARVLKSVREVTSTIRSL